MPGKEHMKGVSPKRNRQYEHIKDSLLDGGKDEERAKEEAARTVNKQRREKGETKEQKGSHVTSVELIPGPYISEMTRTAAERGLQQHPAVRKGAAYALEQMNGQWVAAVIHEAAPPPFGGGGPADADEEAPAPKSEGPDDEEPSEGDDSGGPPDAESDSSDKPPHEKGGEKGELHQVMQMLQQIGEALGIPLGLGASPVPGQDDPGGPGASGPPPPGGPPGPGGPAEQHVIHEKTMKPGEVPPGGTPIGAPAFASVRADHPWAHIAGKVASWEVSERIGNTPIHKVAAELESLCSEIGYRYKLREARDESGERVAVALITKH